MSSGGGGGCTVTNSGSWTITLIHVYNILVDPCAPTPTGYKTGFRPNKKPLLLIKLFVIDAYFIT